jgi:uncharacterized damage-inducible protein DinB
VYSDVWWKWEKTDMTPPEELARFKEEVRQRTRLVLEKVTQDQLDWMPAPQALTIRQMVRHMRLSEEGSFQVVQHGDWGYSARRRTAPLVTLIGEAEPWEAELSAFERAHQDWLAWIRAVPADGLTQELVNPQNDQRSSALAFVLARLEHEVHHRAQISTYLRMLGEQWPSPYGKLP